MATIEEEMKAWEEKEKQQEMLKKELSARMNAYKDIAIIRRWIKFWSLITIIIFIIALLQMCGSMMITPS